MQQADLVDTQHRAAKLRHGSPGEALVAMKRLKPALEIKGLDVVGDLLPPAGNEIASDNLRCVQDGALGFGTDGVRSKIGTQVMLCKLVKPDAAGGRGVTVDADKEAKPPQALRSTVVGSTVSVLAGLGKMSSDRSTRDRRRSQTTQRVRVENGQLVTKSENLRLQRSAGPKNGGDQSKKGDEKRVHRGDYNLTRNRKRRVFSVDGIFGSQANGNAFVGGYRLWSEKQGTEPTRSPRSYEVKERSQSIWQASQLPRMEKTNRRMNLKSLA
jgi:hypothetical protein